MPPDHSPLDTLALRVARADLAGRTTDPEVENDERVRRALTGVCLVTVADGPAARAALDFLLVERYERLLTESARMRIPGWARRVLFPGIGGKDVRRRFQELVEEWLLRPFERRAGGVRNVLRWEPEWRPFCHFLSAVAIRAVVEDLIDEAVRERGRANNEPVTVEEAEIGAPSGTLPVHLAEHARQVAQYESAAAHLVYEVLRADYKTIERLCPGVTRLELDLLQLRSAGLSWKRIREMLGKGSPATLTVAREKIAACAGRSGDVPGLVP